MALVKLSSESRAEIANLLGVNDTVESRVSLELTIEDYRWYTLDDLANYMKTVDRLYGRLAVGNLKSYSRSRRKRLLVNSVRPANSFELVLEAWEALRDGSPLLLLALLIAKFPEILKAIPGAMKTIQESRLLQRQIAAEDRRAEAEGRETTSRIQEETAPEQIQTLSVAEPTEVTQVLSDVDIYSQLSENARDEISILLPGVIIEESWVQKRRLERAYSFNYYNLERVVLVVRPKKWDPRSEDARIRRGEMLRIEIPIAKDDEGERETR